MQVYLAGPLFSKAEQAWLSHVKQKIKAISHVHVVCPTDFIIDIGDPNDLDSIRREIFRQDIVELQRSDILVAILDGPQVDDETAMAIGYFHALKKDAIILGPRTDFRRTGMHNRLKINGVVDCACTHIFTQVCDLVDFLSGLVGQKEQNDEMAVV
jgi:nucleoside 2-deoxyribosyltransferase